MLTRPGDLTDAQLRDAARNWGLRLESLEYRPVGAGSHHWAAVDHCGQSWFLTVDDLSRRRMAATPDEAYDKLRRTWETVRGLADLEFVLAPYPAPDGSLLTRIPPHYALTVFPYVAAEPLGDGDYTDDADRRAVLEMLARLHAVAPGPDARRDDFTIPGGKELAAALDTETGWDAGPYGAVTRDLVRESRKDLRTALRRYDELAARVRSRPDRAVLTHGEPHSANVLRRADGRLLLIDWDTVLVAPPERDLAGLLDGLSTDAARLYRAWWDLAEICEYVDRFRRPHTDDADARSAWADLQHYLPVRPALLEA